MLTVVSKGLLPKKHTPNITFVNNNIKNTLQTNNGKMATPTLFLVDINNEIMLNLNVICKESSNRYQIFKSYFLYKLHINSLLVPLFNTTYQIGRNQHSGV